MQGWYSQQTPAMRSLQRAYLGTLISFTKVVQTAEVIFQDLWVTILHLVLPLNTCMCYLKQQKERKNFGGARSRYDGLRVRSRN